MASVPSGTQSTRKLLKVKEDDNAWLIEDNDRCRSEVDRVHETWQHDRDGLEQKIAAERQRAQQEAEEKERTQQALLKERQRAQLLMEERDMARQDTHDLLLELSHQQELLLCRTTDEVTGIFSLLDNPKTAENVQLPTFEPETAAVAHQSPTPHTGPGKPRTRKREAPPVLLLAFADFVGISPRNPRRQRKMDKKKNKSRDRKL